MTERLNGLFYYSTVLVLHALCQHFTDVSRDIHSGQQFHIFRLPGEKKKSKSKGYVLQLHVNGKIYMYRFAYMFSLFTCSNLVT